jgi:hypothetical protein
MNWAARASLSDPRSGLRSVHHFAGNYWWPKRRSNSRSGHCNGCSCSGRPVVGQSVIAPAVAVDRVRAGFSPLDGAIEVRIDPGTDGFYWRSEWDWDSGGGGVTEWTAFIGLFVGPAIAAALAYVGVVQAGSRRIGRRRWRITLMALAAPVGACLALVAGFAIYLLPLLLWSERTS